MIQAIHLRVIVHRAVMTVDHHLVQVGIEMKNINHLAPLYNFYKIPWLCTSRRAGFKFSVFKLCTQHIPELECEFFADFPFNPKFIPKVKNRKSRKACYQSFMLYKKSFKPIRIPRIRIIKDENPWFKHDDHIDAVFHLFTHDAFRQQYLNAWGDDIESKVFKGWNGRKGVIYHDQKS